MSEIRVLIADDHAIVRQGLRSYFELLDDIVLVGEARNGLEAVEQAVSAIPDIVLIDLVMPEIDGIEATWRIKQHHPEIQIIVLTSFTDDEKVFPAIKAGASGYLLKDVSPRDLHKAIQAVHRGESQLHPEITEKLMNQFINPKFGNMHTTENLTPRELEVYELIAQGMSNREIAEALVISEKTVKTHVSSILGKLGLQDRTQAAIYAYKHNLFSSD